MGTITHSMASTVSYNDVVVHNIVFDHDIVYDIFARSQYI